MKAAIIGSGYVGLVSGACFAEVGHSVICVDTDGDKIDALKKGGVSIYEPGLDELVKSNLASRRLAFTTDVGKAVRESELIFIAVGTPSKPDGGCDLAQVRQASWEIGRSLGDDYKVIAVMSTVPIETGDEIEKIITRSSGSLNFDLVSNPEFLQEGSAVGDRMNPRRIVIGAGSGKAAALLEEFYKPFGSEVMTTDRKTAEMAKYACNAFLATKISFINEIATICEEVGADVTDISKIMGKDPRIGPHFLNAGLGYGGSCFPKDTRSLDQIANLKGHYFALLKSVIEVNNIQRQRLLRKILYELQPIDNKRLAVLGLAFKPNTDDIRESIAVDLVGDLLEKGARVKAHDPIASTNASKILGGGVCSSDLNEVVAGSDAVIIATEWPVYRELDLEYLKKVVAEPVIFDGRNVLDPDKAFRAGFKYFGTGRQKRQPDIEGIGSFSETFIEAGDGQSA